MRQQLAEAALGPAGLGREHPNSVTRPRGAWHLRSRWLSLWPCLAVAACLAGATGTGCRRDAERPLTQQQLFPDAASAALQVVDSAKGSVARSEPIAEVEPNDGPELAQALLANALVTGSLERAAPAEGVLAEAPSAKLKKKAKQPKLLPLVDEDWYRLPALAANQVVQLELRDAPACAELELRDDAGKSVLRKAKSTKGIRAALPSVGAAAGGSLVRVSCRGVEGGPYTLAAFTREPSPGEEIEPNDTPRVDLLQVRLDSPAQGTLAPLQDNDLWVLDLQGAPSGDALVLSATGVPDVDIELQLIDRATKEVLLTRRPGKGQPILVPNLDPARLPAGTLLQLRAVSGQSVDSAYALAVQTYLPPGCARQAECRDRLPSEREPNDSPGKAQGLAIDPAAANQFAGLLDTPGDIDWLSVELGPDLAVQAQLDAPTGMALRLVLGQGPAAPYLTAAPGKPARLGGAVAVDGRLLLGVQADKEGMFARTEAYRLTLKLTQAAAWERESGDEREAPTLWNREGGLQLVEAEPGLAEGGWQRRGVLMPAGDRDAFGLDLRGQPTALGVELQCFSDGEPGFSCAITDLRGQILARVAAPTQGQPARLPLALAPGAYKVLVEADRPRASLQPYRVVVRRAQEAAGLPVAGSPTAAP